MAKAKITDKPPVVVVDADAIVAQAHPQDSNHQKALQTAENLKNMNAQMIYPITAICEAVTVLQYKLSSTASAYGTAVVFTNPQLQVTEVNQNTIGRTVNNFFKPETSKNNTLFDCIIIDTAEKYKADAIFSFDRYYKKQGFKLAEEL